MIECMKVMGKIIEKIFWSRTSINLKPISGTPQIISALFALNRINDYNTQAIQVATPNKSANRKYAPLSSEDEQRLFDEIKITKKITKTVQSKMKQRNLISL